MQRSWEETLTQTYAKNGDHLVSPDLGVISQMKYLKEEDYEKRLDNSTRIAMRNMFHTEREELRVELTNMVAGLNETEEGRVAGAKVVIPESILDELIQGILEDADGEE